MSFPELLAPIGSAVSAGSRGALVGCAAADCAPREVPRLALCYAVRGCVARTLRCPCCRTMAWRREAVARWPCRRRGWLRCWRAVGSPLPRRGSVFRWPGGCCCPLLAPSGSAAWQVMLGCDPARPGHPRGLERRMSDWCLMQGPHFFDSLREAAKPPSSEHETIPKLESTWLVTIVRDTDARHPRVFGFRRASTTCYSGLHCVRPRRHSILGRLSCREV